MNDTWNVEARPSAARAEARAPAEGTLAGPILDRSGAVFHLRRSTCNLRRSLSFYTRVLGFKVVDDGSGGSPGHAMLRMGRGIVLTLEERKISSPSAGLGFVVEDLDRVRETLWNLGVAIAGSDRGGASSPRRRVLRILDPDGHEIELIETGIG
jgi:catechol 2,3-dioxygenase-like lactoylglutathione lyase family enzyme